jgi:hypothetical protein
MTPTPNYEIRNLENCKFRNLEIYKSRLGDQSKSFKEPKKKISTMEDQGAQLESPLSPAILRGY